MSDPKSITIKPAKGRPMLTWVGKRPLRNVTAYPAQLVETYGSPLPTGDRAASRSEAEGGWGGEGWPSAFPQTGLLFHGDNKDVLAHLLANGFRGKVKLIYIDPPFDSGADYVRKVALRGINGTVKLDGESYALGEQIQYTDIWTNDNYLQFMFERLMMLKELLGEEGFIFLQCDHRKNHHIRCLLDEVFGADNFRNEIASRRGTTSVQAQFQSVDNLIPGYYTTLFYSKSCDAKLPILKTQRVSTQPGKWDTLWRNHDRPTMRYELLGVTPSEGQWRWAEPRAKKAVANYIRFRDNYEKSINIDGYLLDQIAATGEMLDFIRMGPDGTVQCYIPPQQDRLANNVWMDFPHMGSTSEYPTEKSEEMLRRVIEWASNPGDIVLDCFIGSGTTAAVAQKLGRRWIAADINKGAIQTTANRLQSIIAEQVEKTRNAQPQLPLPPGEGGGEGEILPAQLGFSVYRVNDYDLQVQYNEALNLAIEHIGVTRIKTDAYFDGTLGKRLVKVIPFNHPLTPLDLEEIQRELANRPEEERDVVAVCLGKELAIETWLEDWNRNRTRTGLPNKIEVIELRSDPKYGGFLVHQPAEAEVSFTRLKDKVTIEITNFISPTILERLKTQSGLLTPQIKDWRCMVDSLMIDTAYDGQTFNIILPDVPERKDDLVIGKYELVVADGSTVAVKLTDMLGEEVLVEQVI